MNAPDTTRLERWVGRILGWGTVVSTILLAAGLLLELLRIAPGAAVALTNAGLVILMATPLARVGASVMEYVLEREWLFASLTSLVLAILLGSLAIALG
jgi:uncharacterized membrane protein